MLNLVFSLSVLLILTSVLCQHPPVTQFRVIRQWKYFNFTWPDESTYIKAVEQHHYSPKNIILKRLRYYDGWYYLTLPRMKSGTPATLVKIPESLKRGTAPPLEPFPSWQMNVEGNCEALQNVQSIEIDDKGLMWIVDLGVTSVVEKEPNTTCPSKLVIYDINKQKVVVSYVFPDDVVDVEGYLYDIVVDGNFAYITDNSADSPGIVVYSMKDNDSWKISHPKSMSAEPNAQEFRLNGVVISQPINIAPIALGPRLRVSNGRVILSDDRDVYYSPFSSFHLYSITTDILRNKNNHGNFDGVIRDWGQKASQTDSMIMDNQGILYYSLLTDNSIGLWDSKTPFTSAQRVVARDNNYIQWLSSFSFDNRGNLTVASTRMQNLIAYGEFNITQNNFWILSAHSGGRSYVYDFNEYQPLPTTSPDYDGTSDNGSLEVNPTVSRTPSTTVSSTIANFSTTVVITTSTSSSTNSPLDHPDDYSNMVQSSGSQGGLKIFWGCVSLVLFGYYTNW
ncbi:protein yellow-like [Agrilus planipennis]|uniref:Protein yellow-like n=1 Tax=Agrilus planipennis TaxID=224129 RepID=A0A1W4XS25_AGRPL|nr:protein yellow-like [Agrilus planipennis]